MKRNFPIEFIEKAKQKENGSGFASLTRQEKYSISGISPSSQRRYEKIGLEEGTLTIDSLGILHLNADKYNQMLRSVEGASI